MRPQLLWTVACFALASSARAQDYVCAAVTNSNPPLTQAWNQRCIPYAISSQGELFANAEMRALIAESFEVWSNAGCTDLEFLYAGETSETDNFDPSEPSVQRNVIASIEDEDDLDTLPDPRLLAVTLTRYSTKTGEIVDADILFNSITFRFADLEPNNCSGNVFDLRNTLVHEIGHLIGFDHVTDSSATMFAAAEACETKKRDLGEVDRSGVCDVYGAGNAVATCAPPPNGYDDSDGLNPRPFRDQCERILNGEPGGCSCSSGPKPGSSAPAPGFALLSLATLWSLRRYKLKKLVNKN